MKPMHRLCALVVVLAAAGCTSLAPRYERPPAPVPAAFPQVPAIFPAASMPPPATAASAAPAAVVTSPADALAWADFFADPRLRRLITLGLEGSRDLRIATLAIEQARAALRLREADRWPTLNAGLTGSRQPNGRGGITSVYSAGVQVTAWEADLFGRLANLGEAAAAQVLATAEGRKAVQMSLVAAIASAHLALVADEALLDVTRRALATREDSYRLLKLRFDNGASSEVDLRLAESLRETARAALAQATRQRALDENALALLLGQPLPADLPPPLALEAPVGAGELPVGLPSEVLVRRPDVRQAEQLLIAAHANIGAARAAFFPRITLTGSAGSVSNELSGLFRGGSFAWSFAPALLQTIFDAGRNDANVELARLNREVAVAQYERAIQAAFREVADALAGRATLVEQRDAQRRLVEAEAVRTRLADLRWRNGAASYLDVLDAQRSLLAAQQGLVQVQAQWAQNQAALYKALGGGWLDAPAAAAAAGITPARDPRTTTTR